MMLKLSSLILLLVSISLASSDVIVGIGLHGDGVNANCAMLGCQNQGVCVQNAGQYICLCQEGYSGDFCDVKMTTTTKKTVIVEKGFFAYLKQSFGYIKYEKKVPKTLIN